MVVPKVATNQQDLPALLSASARSVLGALLIGGPFWLLLTFLCHADASRAFADRFVLLLLVVALQMGFLLVSLTRRVGQAYSRRPTMARLSAWKWWVCANTLDPPYGLGLAHVPHRSPLLFFLAGGLCMFAAVLLGLLYDVLLRWTFGAGSPTIGPWGEVRNLQPFPAALILTFGVLLGPAGDERFFRAGLFGVWTDANRPWSGALLSSILFALARFDLWNLPAYFGLGLLLCAVYRWTGSLLSAWIAHALLNAAMFALLYCGYA